MAAYPATDFDTPVHDKVPIETNFESGMVLSQQILRIFYDAYIVKGQDKTDPRLSVTHAAPLKFPSHVLVVAPPGDSLFKEGRRFIEHLEQGNHPDARLWIVEHESHGWDKAAVTATSIERREKAYEEMCRTVQQSWSK